MDDINSVASVSGEFGLDLFHLLSANSPDTNLFFSPISISFALTMTYLGASGNTRTEMKSALKFNKINEDKLHHLFLELNNRLFYTKDQNYTLFVANKLFGEKTFGFLHEFLNDCKHFYGAELEAVDFKNKPSECEKIINKWVEIQTKNKIKDLISPGVLNALTRLVLVNAIYFKGDWKEKFDVRNTKDEDFLLDNNEKIKVPMMHFDKIELKYNFIEELNCQVIELPYVGNKLKFLAILPDLSKTDLPTLEKNLSPDILIHISEKLYSTKVQLWLPKFKLESSFELADTLKKLGIADLFTEGKSDLSKIDGTENLYVSKVVHKAFVEVNEEGSEAAAATGVVKMTKCAMIPRKPIVFKADHPFLFLIKDNETGTILFFGKLMKP